MNLDTDLKRAMRRESPPAGFAERVMQRIERPERRTRPIWWRAAAASVMLAVVLGGGYALHRQHEGERAREQVLRAMSIASEKVAYAQQQVREIGSH
jgi:hypothetical protein